MRAVREIAAELRESRRVVELVTVDAEHPRRPSRRTARAASCATAEFRERRDVEWSSSFASDRRISHVRSSRRDRRRGCGRRNRRRCGSTARRTRPRSGRGRCRRSASLLLERVQTLLDARRAVAARERRRPHVSAAASTAYAASSASVGAGKHERLVALLGQREAPSQASRSETTQRIAKPGVDHECALARLRAQPLRRRPRATSCCWSMRPLWSASYPFR